MRFCQFGQAYEEAEAIVKDIREKGYSYKDTAVLYRTNAQSRILEEEFVAYNIPYRMVAVILHFFPEIFNLTDKYLNFSRCLSDGRNCRSPCKCLIQTEIMFGSKGSYLSYGYCATTGEEKTRP